MQASTRYNLEQNYNYHASLAEYHKALVPTESIPVNVDVPFVSGSGIVGYTLSSTVGNWTNEPDHYTYVWKAAAVIIPGATDSYYIVTEADIGKTITCVVTAINTAGGTAAPPSNAVTALDDTTGSMRSAGVAETKTETKTETETETKTDTDTKTETNTRPARRPPEQQQSPEQQSRPRQTPTPPPVPTARASEEPSSENRDKALYDLHGDTARQIREVLDADIEAETPEELRARSPVKRNQTKAMAHNASIQRLQ